MAPRKRLRAASPRSGGASAYANGSWIADRLVVVTRVADGSATYDLHSGEQSCRFTVAREGLWTFGCSGISWRVTEADAARCPFLTAGESELTSLCHEAGWLTFGPRAHRRVLRKILRAARSRNRRKARDEQLRISAAADYVERLEREVLS